MQGVLTSLLLPPLLLALLPALAVPALWRSHRRLALLLLVASLGQLALATPAVSKALLASLEGAAPIGHQAGGAAAPAAIIVLGGDGLAAGGATAPGPLTLQRLRAGAALHRRTGLPLLVTAGPVLPGLPPLGPAMAASLEADFGVPVRWIEAAAADTRDNARLGAALLREAGIGGAWLVTHGWHMPRAQAAFARRGFATRAWPADPLPPLALRDPREWLPGPMHLAQSWLALREWAGRLVYALRD